MWEAGFDCFRDLIDRLFAWTDDLDREFVFLFFGTAFVFTSGFRFAILNTFQDVFR